MCSVLWCGVWARPSIRWLAGASLSGCVVVDRIARERSWPRLLVGWFVRSFVCPARYLAVYLLCIPVL